MKFKLSALMMCLSLTAIGCGTDGSDGEPVDETTGTDYDSAGVEAWGEAHETRASGKADTTGCSGVVVPDSGGFGGRIALTFDDGPKPETTNIVLDVLRAHDIKATFFINGSRVSGQSARDSLKRILDDGHLLANHSHNHSNLGTMSDLARVESEVDRTHQIIEDAGGDPVYFRFPFGSSTCATADLVRSFGYRVTGWHNDSADWCFASSRGGVGYCDPTTFKWVPDSKRDDMVGLVIDQAVAKNGGILLFHDVHMNTATTLDEIITRLKAQDFTFVNIDDVSTFPLLNNDDLNDVSWTGTTCLMDDECDFGEGSRCLPYEADNATRGFCTTACEGYCDDFPGRAPTFCVPIEDGTAGTCMSKPASQNSNCADLPGTVATSVTRFVGNSSAPATTSEVCHPASLL